MDIQMPGALGQVSVWPEMPARKAFNKARMLVIPSRWESFPYIVLEAAAAGLGVAIGSWPLVEQDIERGRLLFTGGPLADPGLDLRASRQFPGVKAGEVHTLGVLGAGLMGAGRTEFAMSLFGHSYGTNISGSVKVGGKPVDTSTVAKAVSAGLSYVTEDRKALGLVLDETILKNTTLANLEGVSSRGVIDANRCLAWVLQKPGPIPLELRAAVGDRIYGCDDCQEACPPNRLEIRRAAPGSFKRPRADSNSAANWWRICMPMVATSIMRAVGSARAPGVIMTSSSIV